MSGWVGLLQPCSHRLTSTRFRDWIRYRWFHRLVLHSRLLLGFLLLPIPINDMIWYVFFVKSAHDKCISILYL